MKKIIVKKEELDELMNLKYYVKAFRDALADVERQNERIWERLTEKYKLDTKKNYIIDHKTRELKQK